MTVQPNRGVAELPALCLADGLPRSVEQQRSVRYLVLGGVQLGRQLCQFATVVCEPLPFVPPAQPAGRDFRVGAIG